MENLWFEYAKTQQHSGWDLEKQHPEVVPRSRLEEIWAWEDYAIARFVDWIQDLEPRVPTVQRERADLA